ncbi:MAG: hypothetical protein COB02_02545 [Candidatus Cloacimonadota bacterium]|nr:MAG: hypothetical protein COB02_02545 [Candidatus Cloacimonadota bacterium]
MFQMSLISLALLQKKSFAIRILKKQILRNKVKIIYIIFYLFLASKLFCANPPGLFLSETLSTASLLEEKAVVNLKLKKKSQKPPKIYLLSKKNLLVFHPELKNWQIINSQSQKTTHLTTGFLLQKNNNNNIIQYKSSLFYSHKNQIMQYDVDKKINSTIKLPFKISINQIQQSNNNLYIYGINNQFVQFLFIYNFKRKVFKAPIKNFNVSNFTVGSQDELIIIRRNKIIYFQTKSKKPFIMHSNIDPNSGDIFLINQNVFWHSYKPFVITHKKKIPLQNSVSLKSSIGDIYRSTDHKLFEVSWNVHSSQFSIYKLNEDIYPQD